MDEKQQEPVVLTEEDVAPRGDNAPSSVSQENATPTFAKGADRQAELRDQQPETAQDEAYRGSAQPPRY